MSSKGTVRPSRPARPLITIGVLLAGLFGGMFALGHTSPKLGLDLQGGTSITLTAKTSDGAPPTPEAMTQAVSIIRDRVNGTGVAEAEVTTQGQDTIVVQVPGIGSDELVSLVGQTAELRFRPVLQAIEGSGAPTPTPTATPSASSASPTGKAGASTSAKPSGATTPKVTAQPKASATPATRGYAREPLAKGTPTPSASPSVAPIAATPEPSATPAATAASDQTGDITEQMVNDLVTFDCTKPQEKQGQDDPKSYLVTCNREGNVRYLLGPADVVGSDIKTAQAGIPQNSLAWQVDLTFTSEGTDKFAESTKTLSAKQYPENMFAIVLDGQVVSSPTVNEPIPGGQARITGQFTQQEAQQLADVLKYGALPLTFDMGDVTTVSPTLGADQLHAGLLAGAVGLGLVVLYALIYYRALGFVVAGSLLVAGGVTYGAVVLLGAYAGFTLTLAGIAGLIVSIGITADSFIVYFERIRDEIRDGRSIRMAVETGWLRARRTIITSDMVSMAAAVFLYLFSVGSVRGFAYTLGLTTAIDLIVVFLFTKPFVTLLSRTSFFSGGHAWSGLDQQQLAGRDVSFTNSRRGLGNRLYTGQTSVDFVGRSRRWYVISAALLAVSLLGIGVRGLTLGIEFTGGAEFSVPVTTVTDATVPGVRDAVVSTGIANAAQPRVTVVGGDQVRVQTGNLTHDQATEVKTAMAKEVGASESHVAGQVVGPSWGAEITKKATQGLLFFLLFVMLYLAVTFEWKMALAAIVALFHDVFITVGVYAWSGLSVSPATIIGFLTILGYSLYDTVVVFDKVRENTAGITAQSRMTFAEAANLAVNQTLIRSANTSLIALLPITSILVSSWFLLGAGTLKDLSLALFVGVAVGTYSSIFIATPLLADLKNREPAIIALQRRVMSKRGAFSGGPEQPLAAGATATRVAVSPNSQVVGGRVQPRRDTRANRKRGGRRQ